MEDLFINFLAEHDVQERFISNILKLFSDVTAEPPEDYIINSFFWSADDYEFWCSIHNKWIATLNCHGYKCYDYL